MHVLTVLLLQTVKAYEKAGSEYNLNIGYLGAGFLSSHIRLYALFSLWIVVYLLLFPCNKNLIR
jgi:hypothetical protein